VEAVVTDLLLPLPLPVVAGVEVAEVACSAALSRLFFSRIFCFFR
jgi:hypothetical protein